MNHKHVSLKTQCGQTPHLLHQDLRSMGIGMHPHPSHLASPQTPHLVPPLLSDPPALNYAPSPAHDDVRLVPNPIAPQPRPSHPSICTPNLLISHHHKHHTWRLLHYLTHLPSNTQGQNRRLLPHVSLKTQCGQTPHPLNHLKFMTPRRERQSHQNSRNLRIGGL
jgi:hypothetical protein